MNQMMLECHLRRGQRIRVRFGQRLWEAVYWDCDDQGQIVAHQTFGRKWSLAHLDLTRFGDWLAIDRETDPALVEEIARNVTASHCEQANIPDHKESIN